MREPGNRKAFATAPALLAALCLVGACSGGSGQTAVCAEDAGADTDSEADSDTDTDVDVDSDSEIPVDAGDTDSPPDDADEWPLPITGWGDEVVTDLAVAGSGEVALTGTFEWDCTMGPLESSIALEPAGVTDVFLARFEMDGSLQWANTLGGPGGDLSEGVAALADGTTVVTGQFTSEIAVGADALMLTSNAPGTGGFIVGFETDGGVAWARVIETDNFVRNVRVAPLGDGDFLVAAEFSGATILGLGEANETLLSPDIAPATAGSDVLVAKYSATGDLVWARRATSGTSCNKHPDDLAAGTDDAFFVAIGSPCAVTLGQGELSEVTVAQDASYSMVVFAAFEEDGDFRWAERPASPQYAYTTGLAVLGDGSVVASGEFMHFLDFDFGEPDMAVINAVSDFDAFVAKWDSDGEFQWATRVGGDSGAEFERAGLMAIGPGDTIYIAGGYRGDISFGDGDTVPGIVGSGGADGVVARLTADGVFDWAQSIGGGLDDAGWAVGVLPDGTILMGGTFAGLVKFPDGDGFRWLEAMGTSDAFVVRFRPPP